MKIVAVNIAFRDESYYKRWRLLTNMYDDVELTLIGPKYYEYHLFGPTISFKPKPVTEPKFKVRHLNMRKRKMLYFDWWSWKYFKILKEEKPDLVYLIGYETDLVVLKTEIYRKLFNRNLKIGLFTMRGLDMPFYSPICKWHLKWMYRLKWNITKNIFDFANVHYPHGKEIIRKQGKFRGPIYLQTQIGVNKDIYFPNAEAGEEIRQKYDIKKDEFVFSSAVRIEEAKGVFDIIQACKMIKKPFKYLLMGNGRQFNEIQELIKAEGLENKIILTDRIPTGTPVAAHLNASDCFIHVPKTMNNWVDTFPLAVIQAMACGKPLICSDSGALPYQVGSEGIIINEGNPAELANAMMNVMENSVWANEIGNKMLTRVLNCFEIRHLNKCIYQTFKGHIEGDLDNVIEDQVDAFK